MKEESPELQMHWLFDWMPLGLISTGIAVSWIGFESVGWITYLGFATYGVLGLIEHLKSWPKIKRGLMLGLRILSLVLIVIMSVLTLVGDGAYFLGLLALVLLDKLVLTGVRVA